MENTFSDLGYWMLHGLRVAWWGVDELHRTATEVPNMSGIAIAALVAGIVLPVLGLIGLAVAE